MEWYHGFFLALAIALLIWLYKRYKEWRYERASEEWKREHQKELEELENLKERSNRLATTDPKEHKRLERMYLEGLHTLYRTHPKSGRRR
jgi:hypothetical protein